jgi:hypothetical protein
MMTEAPARCPRDLSIPTRAVRFPPAAFHAVLVVARTEASLSPPPGGFGRLHAAPGASASLAERLLAAASPYR